MNRRIEDDIVSSEWIWFWGDHGLARGAPLEIFGLVLDG
jgi:hypothetical protein